MTPPPSGSPARIYRCSRAFHLIVAREQVSTTNHNERHLVAGAVPRGRGSSRPRCSTIDRPGEEIEHASGEEHDVPAQKERKDQRQTGAEDRTDAVDRPHVRQSAIVRPAVPPQNVRKGSPKAETDRRA